MNEKLHRPTTGLWSFLSFPGKIRCHSASAGGSMPRPYGETSWEKRRGRRHRRPARPGGAGNPKNCVFRRAINDRPYAEFVDSRENHPVGRAACRRRPACATAREETVQPAEITTSLRGPSGRGNPVVNGAGENRRDCHVASLLAMTAVVGCWSFCFTLVVIMAFSDAIRHRRAINDRPYAQIRRIAEWVVDFPQRCGGGRESGDFSTELDNFVEKILASNN